MREVIQETIEHKDGSVTTKFTTRYHDDYGDNNAELRQGLHEDVKPRHREKSRRRPSRKHVQSKSRQGNLRKVYNLGKRLFHRVTFGIFQSKRTKRPVREVANDAPTGRGVYEDRWHGEILEGAFTRKSINGRGA